MRVRLDFRAKKFFSFLKIKNVFYCKDTMSLENINYSLAGVSEGPLYVALQEFF